MEEATAAADASLTHALNLDRKQVPAMSGATLEARPDVNHCAMSQTLQT
jgi:hypothetical protein